MIDDDNFSDIVLDDVKSALIAMRDAGTAAHDVKRIIEAVRKIDHTYLVQENRDTLNAAEDDLARAVEKLRWVAYPLAPDRRNKPPKSNP